MEEESGEDIRDVFGRDHGRGGEEGDKKREFSGNTIMYFYQEQYPWMET